MRIIAVIPACAAIAVLSGCVAKTALRVVTAPVRIVSAGADAVTTSQSEADEKRGRELRKREERFGRLNRQYDREISACAAGDDDACSAARATYAEMEAIRPTIPVEPD